MDKIWLWPQGCAPYMDACGGQQAPSLTAYPAKGSRGAVIVCPGGGYTHKADAEGGPIAKMICEAGVSAYVLDYRVSPCPHEAPLGDAQRAIRVLRAMGYEKVGILGFSAGGNLACNAAVHYDAGDAAAQDPAERMSCRPDALISCYSVVSLTHHTHIGSLRALLGERAGNIPLQRYYSAERHVTPDTPPAFIWHTAADTGVPVDNSVNLAAAYAQSGVPFELHIFPDGLHGLGLAKEVAGTRQWSALCQDWLIRQGFAG